MKSLKIVQVASEVAPYARTGGLGDVIGALPRALARQGHELMVCMPRYGQIDAGRLPLVEPAWKAAIPIGKLQHDLSVATVRDRRAKVTHCFIANEHYFDRPELYRDPSTGKDYVDNDERFIFFALAVFETLKRMNWKPDVIHCHDWQAALVPVYLKSVFASDPFFDGVRCLLTIHNLAYQGVFPPESFRKIGVKDELFYAVTGPLEFFGKVNFLKAGIVLADKITTVSRRYAEEIQSSDEYGAGLQDVLRERRSDLTGIVNGVDYTVWSPSRDRVIPYRYNLANLSGKKKTKIELLNKAGLPVRDTAPLVGIISRLADQKGFDLIAEAADRLFAMNLQMVVLGTGEQKYHDLFTELQERYPDRLRVYLKFDDNLAHWIEAGSDIFLMPSRYEPCGLNQLYSLKYGTVPVVRRVGGLYDTVVDYDPGTQSGTGFVFEPYEADAMLAALQRAVELFEHKRPWMRLLKNGMQQDFSWDAAARNYSQLYQNTISS
jgi:starch synthase